MGSSAVQQRRRVKQTSPLDQRLTDQAERLRKEARGTPPGIERERLLRRARQAETAAQMGQGLPSPCLRAPSLEFPPALPRAGITSEQSGASSGRDAQQKS